MNNNDYVSNKYSSPKTVSPSAVLVLGILSMALGNIPYVGALVSLILAIITQSKVKKFLAENNGETCGMVKVGSILSKISLVFSIIALIVYVIYIAIYIIYFAIYGVAITTILFSEYSFMLPTMMLF